MKQFTKSTPTAGVTRRQALRTFSLGFAGLALARLSQQDAKAITNGQLDGNAHPNVGGFVWLNNIWSPDPPPVFIGTGSLIHPRIVLTAGHGTLAVEEAISAGLMTIGELRFSFGCNAADQATWNSISAVITHPEYSDKPEGNGNVPVADVGVAILAEPVNDLPLMPLPPVGFLDGLKASGQLREGADSARFTVVGYGVVSGDNPGHLPFPPDGLRRNAVSAYRNLHERWLFLDINEVHDLGGTALGDSGGPALWLDPQTAVATLVAITSRGNLSLDTKARVDTNEVLTFLNEVIASVEAGEL